MVGTAAGARCARCSRRRSLHGDPVQAPDQHRAGVHAPASLPTPALNVVPGAVSQVAYGTLHVARLPDGRQVHPATGTLTGPAAGAGPQHADVPALPAGGRQAGRRLAGGDLRPRLRRQHVRRAVDGGVDARVAGPRDDLDQRRRPRRRRARHADRAAPSQRAGRRSPAGGRGIDQDGNGAIDSHRRLQRRAAAHRHQQPRRPAPDRGRPDAAGAPDRGRHRRRRRRQRRPGRAAHLLRRPVVRRHLRHDRCSASSRTSRPACPTSPGGSITEVVRGSAPSAPLSGIALASRMPSLINVAHRAASSFDENIPLRDLPPLTNTVAGAMDDPAGARPLRVGAAGRQPGLVRVVHPQAAAARPCGQAGADPVRQGRPDGAEPDQLARSCAPATWPTAPPTSATTGVAPPRALARGADRVRANGSTTVDPRRGAPFRVPIAVSRSGNAGLHPLRPTTCGARHCRVRRKAGVERGRSHRRRGRFNPAPPAAAA